MTIFGRAAGGYKPPTATRFPCRDLPDIGVRLRHGIDPRYADTFVKVCDGRTMVATAEPMESLASTLRIVATDTAW